MFTPIQKILPKAIQALGLARQARAALICEKYRKLAPRLIHTEALHHTLPKNFQGKTLTIGVENPAWAAQVAKRKIALLEALNKELGAKFVVAVKTRVVEKIAPER